MADDSDEVPKEPVVETPVQEEQPAEADDSNSDEFDDEETGGKWVTTANLQEHLHGDAEEATNLMLEADEKLITTKKDPSAAAE